MGDIYDTHTHKGSILPSIRDNRNMIADTDGDIGQIETVETRINIDNHLPIVLRVYWTPPSGLPSRHMDFLQLFQNNFGPKNLES